jgi:RNA:NAD 2'-phosphotransferase (TPT1/KptA family)
MKRAVSEAVGLSKALTLVLRHKAKELGLEITPEGYVSIEELFKVDAIKKYKPTLAILENVVKTSDKKRFELSADNTMIRATQGHSMEEVKEEGLMEPITDASKYSLVLHGSFAKLWTSIYTTGLSKMKRNHIRKFFINSRYDHRVPTSRRSYKRNENNLQSVH